MDLSDIIYKIEYNLAGEESHEFVDETDCDRNQLTLYLAPVITLFDYLVEIDGREIELDEINVMLRYRVTFDFDSIDIVHGTCSYNVDVEFRSAYAFDINERGLLEPLNAQIEADIRDGRNIVIEEPTFKVILCTLR